MSAEQNRTYPVLEVPSGPPFLTIWHPNNDADPKGFKVTPLKWGQEYGILKSTQMTCPINGAPLAESLGRCTTPLVSMMNGQSNGKVFSHGSNTRVLPRKYIHIELRSVISHGSYTPILVRLGGSLRLEPKTNINNQAPLRQKLNPIVFMAR